jgi:hypothetical protein
MIPREFGGFVFRFRANLHAVFLDVKGSPQGDLLVGMSNLWFWSGCKGLVAKPSLSVDCWTLRTTPKDIV